MRDWGTYMDRCFSAAVNQMPLLYSKRPDLFDTDTGHLAQLGGFCMAIEGTDADGARLYMSEPGEPGLVYVFRYVDDEDDEGEEVYIGADVDFACTLSKDWSL